MRILYLAAKDLAQILRDRRSLIFLIAMPVIFTLFMGFAYGKAAKTAEKPPILGLANLDEGGPVSRRIEEALRASAALRVSSVGEGEGRASVVSGALAGFIALPRGYSAAVLEGRGPSLVLVADPASAPGQTIYQVLRGALVRELSSARPALIERELLSSVGTPPAARALESYALASSLWDEADARGLPIRELALVRGGAGIEGAVMPYNQSSPGMIVMFAVFGLASSAGILLQERKSGTLKRLRATAMRPLELLCGHFLAMTVIVFAQTALLVVFGQTVLGVDYAREPLAILAVALALSLCMAGAGLLTGSLARKEEQVTLYSLGGMFILSALGGAWFPIEGTGRLFSTLSKLTPTAWAMTGLQNVLVRGQGLGSAALPSLVLLLFALGFVAASALRFRSE